MRNVVLSMALIAVFAGASSSKPQSAPSQSDQSPPPNNIYAQKIIDQIAAKHPEVTIMSMHMTPPNGTDAILIACSDLSKVGRKSTPEHDLIVMKTGQPTGGARGGRRDQ